MSDKAKAMVMASLAADSLALGPHWIYDQERIRSSFGRVDRLLAPGSDSQHKGKSSGEFTHYGDQTLVLLESVAALGRFDLADFASRWQGLFESYSGYFDQATRGTLQGFRQGDSPEEAGSRSTDLSGASRIGPIIFAHRHDQGQALRAARSQTGMTHNTSQVIDAAEFFGRTALSVLKGKKPVEAMEEAAGFDYEALPAREWLDRGLRRASEETGPALKKLGLSCHIDEAFPGTVQIIARHEGDLKEGLIQCVMAGGDSAARGMLVGLILGAWQGMQSIPGDWLEAIQERRRIEKCLTDIESG